MQFYPCLARENYAVWVAVLGRIVKLTVFPPMPGGDTANIGSKLNDNFSSSPAFAGRRLYMRTRKFLYCIEEPTPRTAGGNSTKR